MDVIIISFAIFIPVFVCLVCFFIKQCKNRYYGYQPMSSIETVTFPKPSYQYLFMENQIPTKISSKHYAYL